MKHVLVSLVLFLGPLARARTVLNEQSSKQYPVTKVVTLLKDMQVQLEKEAEEDEDVYDKMACWCKTNDKEKTESIKIAETRVADLTTTIESSTASTARLNAEIANHESELAKSQKSLDELTAIRVKQVSETSAEDKDMLQSIKALDSAIVVLNRNQAGAALNEVTEVVRTQMDKHKMMLLGVITPHQKRIIGAFLQEGSHTSAKTNFMSFRGGAEPASGEIFGILKQMKETFEANLSESQKEELANSKSYEEQKVAKADEIKAITNSLNEKRTQLAKSVVENAESKEDLEDTQNSLSIDDKFLVDLKTRCKETDEEWEKRQQDRQAEQSAIVEAISILTADAAHDTFSKTFNPAASFMQKKAIHTSKHRRQAARLLRTVAAKVGNPALSGLAMAAELDAFTKVKEAIDKMVTELGEQKVTDATQRDFCIDKEHENTQLTEKKTREKTDSEMKIAGLETTISELSSTVGGLEHEIAEMNQQVKNAGEEREAASKDYQATIADQQETQKLLNKAITVLKSVYEKKAPSASAALVVKRSTVKRHGQAPAGFKDYSQNSGGGGVVAMLTEILGDAKVMQAEATKDEEQEQETYEKFVKDTNEAIASKQAAIVNKSQDKANQEQDLGNTKSDLEQQTAELVGLENAKIDLNSQCEFLLRNFDLRQQAHDEEIEALRQAKAILSGMQTE